nr:MAG TPA: hypothetical protein [Caudoviricetes sp.]
MNIFLIRSHLKISVICCIKCCFMLHLLLFLLCFVLLHTVLAYNYYYANGARGWGNS